MEKGKGGFIVAYSGELEMSIEIKRQAIKAAKEGKNLNSNPYDAGTHQAFIWSMAWEAAKFADEQRSKIENHKASVEKREVAFLTACGFDLSNGFFSDDVAHWKEKEPEVYKFFMERAAV